MTASLKASWIWGKNGEISKKALKRKAFENEVSSESYPKASLRKIHYEKILKKQSKKALKKSS